MAESTEKRFVKIILILLLIASWVIYKTSPVPLSLTFGDTSKRGVRLTSIDNNVTTFEVGYLKDYVHILLRTSKSENLEDGLKFDIINPRGEVVDSGILYDDKRFTETYKGIAGEWEIVFHFEDNTSSTMMDYGYNITSKSNGQWR